MSAGDVRRLADYQGSTLEQRAATIEWARWNHLDPSRILGDSLEVDLAARVIRYRELVSEDTPGAWQPSRNAPWQRPATAALLVDPPPAMLGQPAPRYAPPASYDWAAYERTCAPDRQLDATGDLALFLGGSEDSFIGKMLALLDKARGNPERIAALELGFPREVIAWRTWRGATGRTPTAVELCATLTALTGSPR